MQLIEFFRENRAKIGIAAAVVVLIALAVYGGLQYLDRREAQAQESLGKGISFFHGQIAADAKDDPFARGATPTFRSEEAKFKAAAAEFSAIMSRYSYGKVSVVARYYLGLSQIRLGQRQEAVRNLETVANNSKDRTLGFLAKRALAADYANAGNNKGAAELLAGMVRDPQCQLPKEELSIQLAKVLVSQGKSQDAVKVLTDANAQAPAFGVYKQQITAELEKIQKSPASGSQPSKVQP